MAAHDHAILGTVHATRGVDVVPVVFAVDRDDVDGHLVAVPVDEVKPKASQQLQRLRNLEADPRASLLVEHWDGADWSRLWWVRAELRWWPDPPADRVERLTEALVTRHHSTPTGRSAACSRSGSPV